ncbi:MAG: hypothetical protein KDK30_18020, partial [Leptospiraceae bacterium]|nr:hypothetical protein [Leptospiraceae bacterium]
GDAAHRLREFMPDALYPAAGIDCWYLDGFAPARNPDLWSAHIFAAMKRLSAADATAATYSVAGVVKRGLESAGFAYERAAGFGRKKEMLAAVRKSADTLRNQL